jgi:mevalonate kinase
MKQHKSTENAFNSKILLFGEYSIIQESMGLSVPYEIFNGQLTFEKPSGVTEDFIQASRTAIEGFVVYLKSLQDKGELIARVNIDALTNDLEQGLFFHSNIPQGFGIGSSGALVAAVYDRYVEDKITMEQHPDSMTIQLLKAQLAQMESYFHGSSSGVDPLICYLNIPLLITANKEIEPVKMAFNRDGKGAIFLIDTGVSRKTEPLVRYYMERMQEGTFREFVDKQLKPFTNNCIQALLDGDHETLFGYLGKLSKVQLDHFKPMIHRRFNKMWQRGIDTGDYYLKLCGAGGGGFILGFTQNYEVAQHSLKGHKLEKLCAI